MNFTEAHEAAQQTADEAAGEEQMGRSEMSKDWRARCVIEEGCFCAAMSRASVAAYLAAMARAGYRMEQDWQPIETAPRDGTLIILIGGAYGGLPFTGIWGEHEWFPGRSWVNALSHNRLYDHVPTHWRPITRPRLAP